MSNIEYVEVKINSAAWGNFGAVRLTRKRYEELCHKYGVPEFGWYPVDHSHIKFYDSKKQEWQVCGI